MFRFEQRLHQFPVRSTSGSRHFVSPYAVSTGRASDAVPFHFGSILVGPCSGVGRRRWVPAMRSSRRRASTVATPCTWNLIFVEVPQGEAGRGRQVRASARVYVYVMGGTTREDQKRRERSALAWRTLFLFLRRTLAHLPPLPPLLSRRSRLVPLNKLVRSNDSYFFLVTRLPSFAPTRRLGRLRR